MLSYLMKGTANIRFFPEWHKCFWKNAPFQGLFLAQGGEGGEGCPMISKIKYEIKK
jgi:hypothetical protein